MGTQYSERALGVAVLREAPLNAISDQEVWGGPNSSRAGDSMTGATLSRNNSANLPPGNSDVQSVSEFGYYEMLDCQGLAARLNLPVSWIRDQVRKRAEDPIPHVKFGKYVRFQWLSPALRDWIERRIMAPNSSRNSRVLRKEKLQ